MSEDLPDMPKEQNCKQRICSFLSIAPKGGTPPNYRMMGVCVVALLTSSMTITFLFAFLPEMITRFGYKEEDKGYYVGLVASAYFAGRALFSYFWGLLSDRFGRKLILLITVALHGIFALMFGFTQNITMAIIFRFLTGASNGVVGTAKTILYEISDNTNQAVGMAAISLGWGGGMVIGPALGGYLASPADKYPSVFSLDGFFGQFPYVLACIPVCVTSVLACILIQWKMTESLNKHEFPDEDVANEENTEKNIDEAEHILESHNKPDKYQSISSLRVMDSHLNIHIDPNLHVPYMPTDNENIDFIDTDLAYSHSANRLSKDSDRHDKGACSEQLIYERSSLTSNKSDDEHRSSSTDSAYITLQQAHSYDHVVNNKSYDCNSSSVDANHTIPVLDQQVLSGNDVATRNPSSRNCFRRLYVYCISSDLMFLLRSSEVRFTVFLYSFYSFGVIGFEDVYTIWGSTHPRFDGLGFNTDQLGTLLGAVSIPLLLFQLYVFPFCVARVGLIKTFVIWGALLMVLTTSLPMTHLFIDRPAILWTVLIIITIIERFATNCCFASTSLFVNNSVAPEYAGRVNGISMTVTAIFRAVAPSVGGSVFAWSISQGRDIWPLFNVNFSFFLFGLVFWITTVLAWFMPSHLNYQKK